MEFHEKLQQLRKQKNLTQEQLGQQLFVSRTAISKWESGRGYPNLESLKDISKFFCVSIDELLSGDELIELAETENRANIHKICGLVFGTLDLITVSLLFLPLTGQREGMAIRAVTLFRNTEFSGALRILCLALLSAVSLFGIFELFVILADKRRWMSLCMPCSLGFYAAAILLFVLSRQPYITVFLFLIFMVKIVLLLPENKIK